MTTSKRTITIAAACVGLAALLTYAGAAQPLKVDFSDETVGAEPKSFVSVVGVWRIESDGNNKVLVVDGRQWKEGQTAAGIAENNLVLWKFEKGKRSSVKWIRNTPTPTRQWHDLKVRIAGPKVAAYLDGKLYLEHVLPEPVSGRIGLWSKADSHMYFDDFTVTPAD